VTAFKRLGRRGAPGGAPLKPAAAVAVAEPGLGDDLVLVEQGRISSIERGSGSDGSI